MPTLKMEFKIQVKESCILLICHKEEGNENITFEGKLSKKENIKGVHLTSVIFAELLV